MPYRKILIIKPGAVGDLLQLTPVLRALKNKFPQAQISLLVGSSATAEMFRHSPYLHETIIFDRKGEHRPYTSFLRLWRRLSRDRYDLIVNYQRSNLKAWLLALASFPCRILIYRKARNRTVHAVVNHLETVAPLGVAVTDCHLDLRLGAEDERCAERVLAEAGLGERPLIALNPGASHQVNRLGARQFALLADMLAERLGFRTVIIGGAADKVLADEILAHTHVRPLDLTGKTTLLQLGAVLKRCAVLVSGDTGPMHLATAVDTRVVALFGAADPARTGPVGAGHRVVQAGEVACVPCRKRTCDNSVYLECMERITAEQVFQVIKDIVA